MEINDRPVPQYSAPAVDPQPRPDPMSGLQAVPRPGAQTMQNGDPRPERAVEAARTLTAMVQDLVRQLEEQEAQRRSLQERIRSLEEATRGYGALRDQLREVISDAVSREDLQNMQRVLQALAQDPNHIMVLANVAQQAGKLLTVVQGYIRMQETLRP